ncbi:AAA family ATPase [Adlercreutzia sp. ZJ138]|uniref:AAA family ATPase n=1 Tax=Adlercreutzia sp. ZJ138 TaxID=2709405 RepID=UPI0013EBECF8|nr:AAA family ATPase [Adlercreutzia sp. ZJ138]
MKYINSIAPLIGYEGVVRSPYFVDKSAMISALVPSIATSNMYVCVTRPRRFGKTTNAQMLASFLSRDTQATDLFEQLNITQDKHAMTHCGTHDVVYIDFSALPDECSSYTDYINAIRRGLVRDLHQFAPTAEIEEGTNLLDALDRTFQKTGARFCFIMDEWDSMFFNPLFTTEDQRAFLMFLKQLLKTKPYVELAYMTGVLPITKHSTGSELNMFVEYNAVEDPRFEEFFGFTEAEVAKLCALHHERNPQARVDYEGLANWYDGYLTETGERRFNPRSVVLALGDDSLRSYWTESGPYDEIYYYVRHNTDAVREDIVRMVAGESVRADMKNYAASAMSLSSRNEILSAMVIYGFLTYYDGAVSIPNHELMLKFQDVLSKREMGYVASLALRSESLLNATLRRDGEEVAHVLEAAHDQEVPLLRYANEADLAALVNLVYLAARDRYWVRREEPAGKGVADIAFIPKNTSDNRWTPFIVELKAAGSAQEAIDQIRQRNYGALFADAFADTAPDKHPLAVGICWDPQTKTHECLIEEM